MVWWKKTWQINLLFVSVTVPVMCRWEENRGKKKKTLWISLPASLNGVGKISVPLCKNPEMRRNWYGQRSKVRILDRVVNSKIEKESVLKSEKNPDLQKNPKPDSQWDWKKNVRIYQKTGETAGEIRPVAAKSQNKNNVWSLLMRKLVLLWKMTKIWRNWTRWIRMESISAIRNRKKKPKSFLMKKQERKRKLSSIPRKHRSIRQMKENLLERKNPVWSLVKGNLWKQKKLLLSRKQEVQLP